MNWTRALCVATLLAGTMGCVSPSGLVVTHTPNPSDLHDAKAPEGRPFPCMWFYRTTVSNRTDHPIRITRFEGYFLLNSTWTPANIMNRALTADDFARWYAEGTPAPDGWIPPHAAAVCDPNWHGSTSPVSPRCKWAYEGVDAKGRTYHAEAEIMSIPAK